jgi:hypothetical protein
LLATETSLLDAANTLELSATTKACAVAQKFMEYYSSDVDKLQGMLLTTTVVQFSDGVEILGSALPSVIKDILLSFPDFRFDYEKVEAVSPDVVLISNIRASGTHTDAPHTFGPYEEIKATGIKVMNDPEDFYLTIDTDKEVVTFWRCVAKGPKSGPQSMYEQIGGLII